MRRFAAIPVLALAFGAGCTSSPNSDPTAPEEESVTLEPQSVSLLSAGNTWATKRSGLSPARMFMKAGTIKNVIYVVGGDAGGANTHALSNVDAYDVATNTWSRRQPLPGGRSRMNGASVIDGKLYLTGGFRHAAGVGGDHYVLSETLFVYDPETNIWVRKSAMPVAGLGGAQGVIGGFLYVYLGGSTDGQTRFLRYNPATNAWAKRTSPASNPGEGVVGGVINGKFYLAGGTFGGGPGSLATAALIVYNPATNSWTTKASMLTARRNHAGAVINEKLYVAGGNDNSDGTLKTAEVYDPVTNRWTSIASMPTEQGGAASTVASGKLFVIGGYQVFLTTKVQAYSP
jgi:N-acetylneuraminic acid mutarotase